MAKGKVLQVIGPTVDLKFESGQLPELLNAVHIDVPDKDIDIIVEVALHLGDNVCRCISMKSTDGLVRGMPADDMGGPITIPVGRGCLGRIFNLLGEAIDTDDPVPHEKRYPIHRPAPPLADQSTEVELFETGLKVVDLLAPYMKGGKVGMFGGSGVGKTVLIAEMIHNIA